MTVRARNTRQGMEGGRTGSNKEPTLGTLLRAEWIEYGRTHWRLAANGVKGGGKWRALVFERECVRACVCVSECV